MHMVGHTANDERLTVELSQNAAKVTVQLLAEWLVAEKWAAVFG
jgi:hypothetical protein